jgi:hypothetical protein
MKHTSTTPDQMLAEIRRLGLWVVLGIVAWSAGWFVVHQVMEARAHHAADPR